MRTKLCIRILILTLLQVYGSEGQNYTSLTNSTTEPITSLPVSFCDDEKSEHDIMVPYHESNETHINTDVVMMRSNFTTINLNCLEGYETLYDILPEEISGFTFNASLIYKFEERLVPPDQYCVYKDNGDVRYRICEIRKLKTSRIDVYLPFTIVSVICYFGSAIIYYFILKVKDDHKKCFIGYCVSMGVTFIFLIILQTVGTGCDIIGTLFFMFIFSSFVWLLCLCADLNFMIRNFRKGHEEDRIYSYVALSILYPCFMISISLNIAPEGSPDVPKSFIKNYYDRGMELCDFNGSNHLMFFIPTGLIGLLSITSLCYSFYLINLNDRNNKNDISWLERRSEFKYMRYECMTIILIVVVFYILELAITIAPINSVALCSISSLQGVFVVIVFIMPYYIRKEASNPQELEALRQTEYYQ